MKRSNLVRVFAVAFLFQQGCGTASNDAPDRIDFCKVAREPEVFSGRRVTVRAQILSDLLEHTLIVSDDCSKEAIVPIIASRSVAGSEELMLALEQGMPNRKVIATFTGEFVWNPQENPARVLNVLSISEIFSDSKEN
jgi:hypothetical protein